MALIKWAQISGGKKLFADVAALTPLLKSAVTNGTGEGNANGSSLIGFTYTETETVSVADDYTLAEGESWISEEAGAKKISRPKTTEYTVAETLQSIKDSLAQISGNGSGTSLTSLQEAVDDINSTVFADYVKISLAKQSDGTYTPNFTVEAIADAESGADNEAIKKDGKTVATYLDTANTSLPVYADNGATIFDSKGEQVKYNLTTNAFSYSSNADGKFYTLDATKGNSTAYKEFTGDVKVFATANCEFGKLDKEYLLDNQEMQLASYDAVIAQIIARFADDETLVADIKEAIGAGVVENIVTNHVANATQTLDARITANNTQSADNKEDIKSINARLKTVEAEKVVKHQSELIAFANVTAVSTNEFTFALAKVPQDNSEVKVIVNGIVYSSTGSTVSFANADVLGEDGVTVTGKTTTVTFKADFALEEEDEIIANYMSEENAVEINADDQKIYADGSKVKETASSAE